MRFGLVFAAVLAALLADGPFARAQDKLIYVKKATREESRKASLEASGQISLPGGWHLIGPFENSNFNTAHPPEKAAAAIDLSAKYPGKGEEAVWRKFDFADGAVHKLNHFKQANNCACYLYRQIDSPRDTQLRVSLGSDDQIAVWLNGQKLFKNEAVRGADADQDFVTLGLRQGKNDLLLKVGNIGGDWAFYFNPTISGKLQFQLDRELDRDFPPGGEAAHYRIVPIPLPEDELIEGGGLAFRPDGKLYVATRRGDVWLVDNPLADNPDEVKMKPYVRGLHEILGLTLVGKNDLYLVQRPEITLVRDLDNDHVADDFTTICDKFGCSGDYHEYIFGPARDKEGNFFVTLNVGFGGGHQAKVPYRGFCLKVTPKGQMIPWAFGLRSPNGVNFSPDGRLYYCDNQGEWVAACKMHEIRQGEFYGHAASVRWWTGPKPDPDPQHKELPKMTPPVLWFPYSMSKSATEPIWDVTEGKFGPFAGQAIIGDLTNSLIMRANLEEVKGRMQGACFLFRKGFQCGVNRLAFAPDGSLFVAQTNRGWGSLGGRPHGLDRVIYTGKPPFEMHSMKITPTGWDVTFTEPVDGSLAVAGGAYFLESYTYHHWATYGSPEIDRKQHEIAEVKLSADGRTVSLSVPKRDKLRVYHLQLKGLKSATGAEILPGHEHAYYTMNETPE